MKYRIKRRYRIGLLRKCWHCGHVSKTWQIFCENCGVDKMKKDDNEYNVLDNSKKNNAYYVADGGA